MASQLWEYKYTPLAQDFIHMILLHAESLTDELRIRISLDTVMVTVGSWGGTPRAMGMCTGHATGTMGITKNLKNLLLGIREKDKRIPV